jgi:leucine dehydrogenase
MYRYLADFDGHALITVRQNEPAGLTAIIAIHNETLGPAIGGCRILEYPSNDAALTDVLRLSRGMTYKTAIAGIPYGGGKAVIIADPRKDKTTTLLHAMADFIQSLGGRYITSFDSGTTLKDIRTIAERTEFVAGILPEAGDASGSTASGVYHCMRAAADMVFGSSDLRGMRIAIQGLGNVGSRVAARLAGEGASLIIADVDERLAADVAERTGAKHVSAAEILETDADIVSPCALGAILSRTSIPKLKARIVIGGANNQLAMKADDDALRGAGILYCPDYLANAGGIIDLHYQRTQWSRVAVERHVARLAETLREVVDRSRRCGLGTAAVTDKIAEERFRRGAPGILM